MWLKFIGKGSLKTEHRNKIDSPTIEPHQLEVVDFQGLGEKGVVAHIVFLSSFPIHLSVSSTINNVKLMVSLHIEVNFKSRNKAFYEHYPF